MGQEDGSELCGTVLAAVQDSGEDGGTVLPARVHEGFITNRYFEAEK